MTLAAFLAFAGCAVFGSPGASQIPAVVKAVAQRVVLCRGLLLLVVDHDKVGRAGVAQAILAAQAPRCQRLSVADDVIVNIGDPAALKNRVAELHAVYSEMAQHHALGN